MSDEIDRLKRIRNQQFYMNSSQGVAFLWHKYKITRRDVSALLIAQSGNCGCCGCDLDGTKWAIDHNHETGKVRGILCYGCNTGLGKLGGTIAGVTNALTYLRKHGES
jgi:hypothetical protein